MSDFPLGVVVVLIWAVICGAIYIIPSVVAFKRDHPNRWIIFAINMAFGATVIGWIGALVWALNAAHISKQAGGSHGGESGLNLFVNDEKRVRWPDSPAPQPSAAARPRTVENAVDEIERLRQLFVDQHLTVDEFNRLKASVLAGL